MSAERPTLEGLRIDRSRAERRLPIGLILGAIALVAVLVGAIVWWIARPKPVSVRLAAAREVAAGARTTLLNASGYVTARRQATVSSKVTGKILDVLVEEGTRVQAGEVVAHLDPSNVEASLHLAQAQLGAAQHALAETNANLDLAESDLGRQRELARQKIISASDLDHAQSAALALRGRRDRELAEIEVAQRQVDVWQQQLDDTIIRAPFDGVVTSKNAQPGEMISPMSAGGGYTRTGVCTLVDMGSLEIEIDVSENYINRVQADQPVVATLDSYPDWRIPAHVIAIIPTADRQKATVKVRVGFEKLDPRILPDMGVKVAFESTESSGESAARAVIVPAAALRQRDGKDVVWVVHDGRASSRAINVSAKTGDDATVAAGLAPGENVIVAAPADLAENSLVTPARP
ncbi:MAG TPA: efflux RND transporter periplasmic adaptor subunit [Opitutus sp.]|nr:efflux RND transporter periplasmic adaptor subunit [Opitutus sp.]